MMKMNMMKVAVLVAASFLLSACVGGGGGTTGGEVDPVPGGNGGGDTSLYPERGPRLPSSDLSPIREAEDDFGADVIDALVRAAGATPRGASQSSLVDEDGRTADEVTARVVRDDDENVVYEVTDHGRMIVRVPVPPRQDFHLALFTTLLPGIEPDLTSYPHEVLGLWAWDGEFGAFWDKSPSGPPTTFSSPEPTGTATYEGDAVGLHAAGGEATKFLADVSLVADFGAHVVSGEVDTLRSIAGTSLGDLSVTLSETSFSPEGEAFSGETTATAVSGSGKWGARWSHDSRTAMGGTFGFAANDGSVALLGAFEASSPGPAAGGDPNKPVATSP